MGPNSVIPNVNGRLVVCNFIFYFFYQIAKLMDCDQGDHVQLIERGQTTKPIEGKNRRVKLMYSFLDQVH